jgi:hypothetical protein
MNDDVKRLWASTRIDARPEPYLLISLPLEALPEAAALVAATSGGGFAALVVEPDEVSLTIAEALWSAGADRPPARAVAGPYRAVTLALDIDLGVSGYFAPAAVRLGEAGIPIVPQCAYLKDHVLFRAEDTDRAVGVLEALARECAER